MDAGDCALSFGASASNAEHILRHHMEKLAFLCELVNLLFNFWRLIILDRQVLVSLFRDVYLEFKSYVVSSKFRDKNGV